MSDPLVPNFKKGVGRLATDRFDFEDHVEGKRFRHKANQIDLFPTVVVATVPQTNVQGAIAALAAAVGTPVVPDATTSAKGIVQLAGDIGGTAINVIVTRIQAKPISTVVPNTNDVLTWNGSTWTPAPIVSSFIPNNDLSGSNVSQNVIGLTGTGTSPNATVSAKCDIINFAASTIPFIEQARASAGDGGNFTIQAQGGNFADSGHGGSLILHGGGDGFESHVNGGVAMLLGDGTYMVESVGVDNSGSGSKVLSLLANSAITSTQMPANTGSRVIYISDTGIPPGSGIPVGGTILFSAGGKLSIKQGDGAQFVISPNYLPTRTITGNYAMTVTDVVILVDTSSLSISVTLPVPESGRRVVVKDSKGFAATRNISILRFGVEKIEGLAATKLITANWGSVTLDSDGTDWFIV
jgi:hypothetical protein